MVGVCKSPRFYRTAAASFVALATIFLMTQGREWQMTLGFSIVLLASAIAYGCQKKVGHMTYAHTAILIPLSLLAIFVGIFQSPCMTEGLIMGGAMTAVYTIVALMAAFIPALVEFSLRTLIEARPTLANTPAVELTLVPAVGTDNQVRHETIVDPAWSTTTIDLNWKEAG